MLQIIRSNIEQIKKWDWRAILICLMVAFTFWFFKALNADHTTSIQLPISLTYNQDSLKLVPTTPPPRSLEVNVTGYGWTLLRKSLGLSSEPLNIPIIDPINTNFLSVKNIRPLIDEKLNGMKSVNYILEDSIFFDYDTLTTKEVVVMVDSSNISIEEGYRITSPIQINPSIIHFEGPASVVLPFQDTIMLRVDDEGIDRDYDENLSVSYFLSDLVRGDYNRVNVKFEVILFINNLIELEPDTINFPSNYNFVFIHQKGTVDYYIREDEEITPEDSLKLILDFNEISFEDTTVTPTFTPSEKMHDVIIRPKKFKMTIEKK